MNNPLNAIREYDRGAWMLRVEELTGLDFFQLEEQHCDPYGCYDEGMSPEEFVKSIETDDDLIWVFVYGTLKVNGRLSHGFDRYRKKAIPATIKGFKMYSVNDSFPAIIEGEGEITGELHGYASKDIVGVLHRMDGIEGYRPGREAQNMYNREPIEAFVEGLEEPVQAEVYVWNNSVDRYELIESGKWEV